MYVGISRDGIHLLLNPLSLFSPPTPVRAALELHSPSPRVCRRGWAGVRNQIFSASWVYQKSLPMVLRCACACACAPLKKYLDVLTLGVFTSVRLLMADKYFFQEENARLQEERRTHKKEVCLTTLFISWL